MGVHPESLRYPVLSDGSNRHHVRDGDVRSCDPGLSVQPPHRSHPIDAAAARGTDSFVVLSTNAPTQPGAAGRLDGDAVPGRGVCVLHVPISRGARGAGAQACGARGPAGRSQLRRARAQHCAPPRRC